jgi:hypothetical protein
MLFLSIFSYEPANRDVVIKKRMEKGPMAPKGVKVIGEWSAIAGGKVFRLAEIENAAAGLAAVRAWSDLGKIEMIPVLPTEEVLKLAAS